MESHNSTLLLDGDALEQRTWPVLRDYFPHYEVFWRMHLLPLRSDGSINVRRGIDEDFEFLAMFHYTAYENLAQAFEKIKKVNGSRFFPGEIYTNLYGANELATKAIEKWCVIYQECEKKEPRVDTSRFEELRERFRKYRNRIHEQLPAVVVGEHSTLIPRPEKIDQYARWSDVMYNSKPEDFVEIEVQVNNDFLALCSALESAWKRLCDLSVGLLENREYLQKRAKGKSVTPPSGFVIQSVCSNASPAYSATAVNPVLLSRSFKFDPEER
jgi:hypothetical protein